ncbi:MAG: hypothetical protein AAF628_19715 [Planctomycetota bacterium]
MPSGRLRAATLALGLIGLAPSSATLVAQPAAGFKTSVRFANLAAHRRVEWGCATVPFAQGVWTPGQSFMVPGAHSELIPFGASWPDGSVRFAQLLTALDLGPREERVIDVVPGSPPALPFVTSDWVQKGLGRLRLQLAVKMQRAPVQLVDLRQIGVETSTHRRILHFRSRIPRTDLVYDLWLNLFSGQDHAPFELRVTASNIASSAWKQNIEALDLVVTGAIPAVRGAQRRQTSYEPLSPVGPNVVHLLRGQQLYDGQGVEWWGDLLFFYPAGNQGDARRAATLLASLAQPLFGISQDWAASGAYGPFGHIPPPPRWVTDGGRAAVESQRRAFERWRQQPGRVWDDMPQGLLADPSSPGQQQDFGAAKLLQIFASGLPHGIEEARFNALEEAQRPVHHLEANGTPIRAVDHPNWVSWSGRTHLSRVVSPDRLSKPFPEPYGQTNGWWGRDHEHWSSLTLASTYLLTRSPSLRYELENEAELYLSSHTIPSRKPSWSTNTIFAARATGRTLLSMAWNYLCTSRDDIKQRMAARVREVVKPLAEGLQVTGPVRPLWVNAEDPRLLMRFHWRPWEEAQAVLGLEASFRITGERAAHLVAVMATRNLMTFGWKITPQGVIIATAVGWKDNGAPLTVAEYDDPDWVLWSTGTNFNGWSIAAVQLARQYGLMYGDVDLYQRAAFVFDAVDRDRLKPRPHCGYDKFSEWAAVR